MTSELLAANRKINLYLSGDITICSSHRRVGQRPDCNRKFTSHARKGYRIIKSTRRKLVSSAFLLFVRKQHEIAFLTLTFPYKVREGVKINPMLNRFITNLKKNYGLKGFLWTREDQKNGRPHYHMLCDIPYQSIKKINSAWCSAIGEFSPNAVRLPKKGQAIVKDIDRTSRYVTKYITKDQNKYYSERCYSIAAGYKAEPIRLSEFDLRQLEIDMAKNLKFRFYEHCTTIKIWDFFRNNEYFIDFLGNYTENSETLHQTSEKAKAIESFEFGRNQKETGQIPLNFDSS